MSARFRFPARAARMNHFNASSVWNEFVHLAQLTSSVNLGRGAPGWVPPSFVTDAFIRVVKTSDQSITQYSRSAGAMELVKEISRYYSPRVIPESLQPRVIDPKTEVVVTVGASQALSLIATAFLGSGDEALLMEPAFDMYTGVVRLAGATPKYTSLKLKNGKVQLDLNEFANAVTESTRMLFLNNPHNPSGKVFTREELVAIANILDEKAPSCIVVSDEVYEHLVYDTVHVPFASVSESAFERTLSVYSAGKTFSVTGMKTGWVVGVARLVKELQLAQQFIVFCCNHYAQIAIADSLRIADQPFDGYESYYHWISDHYQKKRDLLVEAIKAAGMLPIIPDGAFYILTGVPKNHNLRRNAGIPRQIVEYMKTEGLEVDPATFDRVDYNISRNMALTMGVASIPNSAFFSEANVEKEGLAKDYIRLAFCHPDDVLVEGAERLSR